jgi:branched-subunit amino acid transport protein
MTTDLVLLAVLMGLVTYPSRALPLLAPGFQRFPPLVDRYLRLVGPAMLASLAAVGVLFAAEEPGISVGIELIAVLACVLLVAWRGSLLIGLIVAVVLVALGRAVGLG